jgi:hypothetical protein
MQHGINSSTMPLRYKYWFSVIEKRVGTVFGILFFQLKLGLDNRANGYQ